MRIQMGRFLFTDAKSRHSREGGNPVFSKVLDSPVKPENDKIRLFQQPSKGWQGGIAKSKLVARYSLLVTILLFTIHCSLFTVVTASEKWPGVDESVVEKYAKEHGREAMMPLINTDQGDLLLFVFLLAGTIGGFAAGYYWRILMVEKAPKSSSEKQKTIG